MTLPLGPLNVITGPNGSGKSSLYRALRLLADTARGGVIASLAREGGLQSTLWAGPETISRAMKTGERPVQGGPRKGPVALRLGFAGDDLSYAIDLGLPIPSRSAFSLDPVIKTESIWTGPLLRPSALLVERRGSLVRTRGRDGDWRIVSQQIATFDSLLGHVSDPEHTPEVFVLREQIRSWRFYDHLRTDSDAPARLAQIGTHTPVLADDGHDLAAALQTIAEIGDGGALDAAVDAAFPGSSVSVTNAGGRFEVAMHQHGLLRPLAAAELSDGTLRYLLWIAALLTPRPPELLVLNEPETSLHPDLLPPLARLIADASRRSQVFVVSHAAALIDALEATGDCRAIRLEKTVGETTVSGLTSLTAPAWRWASR